MVSTLSDGTLQERFDCRFIVAHANHHIEKVVSGRQGAQCHHLTAVFDALKRPGFSGGSYL
jgi:hypothetical protein